MARTIVKELKVKRDTDVIALSGSICASFSNDKADEVKITAIGASAVSQATKGIGRASAHVAKSAQSFLISIGFENVDIDGQERSAIVWRLKLN